MQNIYFAGGCFWGVEEYFSRIPGVCDTECGYANGTRSNPTYEEVCSDTTGFAETVRIMYNPDIVALRILVRQFFKIIDPVSVNRQGNDRGSQYRTGIYYTSDEDRGPIQTVMYEIQKDYSQPLAVEFEPLRNFYPAEDYHQDYLQNHPHGYCHIDFSSLKDLIVRPDGRTGIKQDQTELQKRLTREHRMPPPKGPLQDNIGITMNQASMWISLQENRFLPLLTNLIPAADGPALQSRLCPAQ